MHIDPTGLHVEAHLHNLEDESFQAVMHENLRRAPWMLVSIAIHAIALLLVFLLIQPDIRKAPPKALAIMQEELLPEIPDEPDPPDTPIEPEETVEPVMSEDPVIHDNPTENAEVSDMPDDTDIVSAFESDNWATAIGMGPGAAGKGGGGVYGRRNQRGPNDDKVRAALAWLAKHQDDSGRWDADGFMKHDASGPPCDGAGDAVHDVGVTGLALLAFLGAGNTLRSGEYRDNVKRGILWLRENQDERGLFGTQATSDYIYDHCIATIAMCEAMGLSKYRTLRKPAQKAINYLESHRNPYGAWRYHPRSGDNDTSVTGWALMACKVARDFDLEVNQAAFRATAAYFDEMTEPQTGQCGYTKRGSLSSRQFGDHATRFPPEKGETLTAVGLFSRFFLGQDPAKQPVMRAAADRILEKPPRDGKDGCIDHYYWYYGTYALYQMGGTHWNRWVKALTSAVVKTQRNDGNFRGSWDPNGAWGHSGGRVYSTAILALTLQAYHRYTRVVVR